MYVRGLVQGLRLGWVTLAVLALSGCGGEDKNDSTSSPGGGGLSIPVQNIDDSDVQFSLRNDWNDACDDSDTADLLASYQDWLRNWYVARCVKFNECCPDANEDCNYDDLAAGWDSLECGAATFDRAVADACTEQYKNTAQCGEDFACKGYSVGTRKLGEPCSTIEEDCIPGLRCYRPLGGYGVCAEARQVGDACDSHADVTECEQDSQCLDEKCTADTNASSVASCDFGL